MTPFALLALQIGSSFAVFGLFAVYVATPWLRGQTRRRALTALLWMHAFRYVPLALLAPGQTDPAVSGMVTGTIAWGDFASAVMAALALVALATGRASATRWVWAFTVVSSLDIVTALSVGLGNGVYESPLGVGWYVLTLYVPLVCVSQLLIFAELVGVHIESKTTNVLFDGSA